MWKPQDASRRTSHISEIFFFSAFSSFLVHPPAQCPARRWQRKRRVPPSSPPVLASWPSSFRPFFLALPPCGTPKHHPGDPQSPARRQRVAASLPALLGQNRSTSRSIKTERGFCRTKSRAGTALDFLRHEPPTHQPAPSLNRWPELLFNCKRTIPRRGKCSNQVR